MQQYNDNRTGGTLTASPRNREAVQRLPQSTQGNSLMRFADSWLSRLLIGAVVLLLIVMFPLEWLRAPTLKVKASTTVFAPRPGAQPSVEGGIVAGAITAGYDLSEAATVSAAVQDGNNTLVRTLFSDQKETAGPHWLSWDGANNQGQQVADGLYRIEVTAKGPARSTSGSVAVTVDTLPPPLKLANLNDGDKMKTADLTVQGITEPGATVQFADSKDIVAAAPDGGFTLRRNLAHGENKLRIIARDPSGNESAVERTVLLFDRPPALKIESPAEAAWTNQKLIRVTGVTDPGTTVRVNGQQATPDAEGRFAVDVLLDEGRNAIKVETTDAVGNTSTIEQSATLKTHPPQVEIESLPADAVVHETRVRIYGHTEAGVKLSVQQQTVPVDAQGRFDTAVDINPGENNIHVEAADLAGNVTTFDRKIRYEMASGTDLGLPITGTVVGIGLVILLWVLFGGWFGSVSLRLHTDRSNFAPSGRGERLQIGYSLSKGARVTVQVLDAQGHVVSTLLRSVPRGAGDHQITWDGTAIGGAIAAAGGYTILASARTLASHVTSSAPIFLQTLPALNTPTYNRGGDPGYGSGPSHPAGRNQLGGPRSDLDPGPGPGPTVVRRRQ
jgi:flagellar hook assembly protein FlgD